MRRVTLQACYIQLARRIRGDEMGEIASCPPDAAIEQWNLSELCTLYKCTCISVDCGALVQIHCTAHKSESFVTFLLPPKCTQVFQKIENSVRRANRAIVNSIEKIDNSSFGQFITLHVHPSQL